MLLIALTYIQYGNSSIH